MDASEWIDLILRKAQGLRDAGVSSVQGGEGFSAELRPPEPPEPDIGGGEGEEEEEDPPLRYRTYRSNRGEE